MSFKSPLGRFIFFLSTLGLFETYKAATPTFVQCNHNVDVAPFFISQMKSCSDTVIESESSSCLLIIFIFHSQYVFQFDCMYTCI